MPSTMQRRGRSHRSGRISAQMCRSESFPRFFGRLLQNALPRLQVNPPVQGDEQQRRDVESSESGVDGVEDVVRVDRAVGQLPCLHLSPEERRKGDGDGDDPGGRHHTRGARLGAFLGVLDRVRYSPVSIQGDYAEVKYGRGATGYI